MKNNNPLPAGLDKHSVELFELEEKAYALYNRNIISFWQLPPHIVRAFRHNMESMANVQKYFKIDTIEDPKQRLEKFVCTVYGKFDNNPDYIDGEFTYELDFNAACEVLGISKRETDVLRLIALGLTDNEISDELCIASSTVAIHRHHLHQKIKGRNAADITRFACKHELV